MKTCFQLFGFEIGKGWHLLVEELMKDLKMLGWNGDVHQVKEKFGGLRFYIGAGNDKIFDRIQKAEEDSYHICEDCGAPGVLRKGAWLRTLCDEHSDGRKPLER